MLKNVPAIICPELLKILCEMGHGDELTIGDANFPGHSCCKTVIRMDGHSVNDILDAILTLMPLDQYSEKAAFLMQVVPGDPCKTPIWDTYKSTLSAHESRGASLVEEIERFAFYERVKEKSVCVIMTGEKAKYANVILKKGIL